MVSTRLDVALVLAVPLCTAAVVAAVPRSGDVPYVRFDDPARAPAPRVAPVAARPAPRVARPTSARPAQPAVAPAADAPAEQRPELSVRHGNVMDVEDAIALPERITAFSWHGHGRRGRRWRRYHTWRPTFGWRMPHAFAPAFGFMGLDAARMGGGFQGADPCAALPGACYGGIPTGTVAASQRAAGGPEPSRVARPASVAFDGQTWSLDTLATRVAIDPARACAMAVASGRSRDGGEPVTTALRFDTPEPAPCVVAAASREGGAAVTVAWRGEGWTQRAVVALADGADAPEVTIARAWDDADGAPALEVANLTTSRVTFEAFGRRVEVEPGGVALVED